MLMRLALALVLLPSLAYAQDRGLEARLRAAPDDTRLSCEVGWVRFRERRDFTFVVAPLARGIALLGEPSEPALRDRLAACLYSRGRALESNDRDRDALADYERSLALRPNEVVARRLSALRARIAAAWTLTPGSDRPSADLQRLFPGAEHELMVLYRYASPDGRSEAAIVQSRDAAILAVREDGAWSSVVITELMTHNGSQDYVLEVGPGTSPTFVVRQRWDDRHCCDEDGYPDWTEGVNVFLAWRDAGGWSVVALGAVDVDFTADGAIIVDGATPRDPRPPRPRETLRR